MLALVMVALGKPADVTSGSLTQVSANTLFQSAFSYAQKKDYYNAAKYLFAYTQINPPAYANNVNGHKSNVDRNLMFYDFKIQSAVTKWNEVQADLAICEHYPCEESNLRSSQSVVTPPPLQPPPESAVVCTDINYSGRCIFLALGEYGNFVPMGINDMVSSVMVGSQVKLTLFLHADLNSQSITFTSNDPNLTDNPYDSTYSWNDITSAARVQYR